MTAGTEPQRNEMERTRSATNEYENESRKGRETRALELTDFGLGKKDLEIGDLEVGDSDGLDESGSLCETDRREKKGSQSRVEREGEGGGRDERTKSLHLSPAGADSLSLTERGGLY